MWTKGIKRDILLLVFLFLTGAVIFIAVIFGSVRGNFVKVNVDGRLIAIYPLSENKTVEINGAGGTNTLVIENGEAYIRDADCPDRLCVSQGKISRRGQSVICLPHKVVVEITDENGNASVSAESDSDIVVR